MVDRFLGWKLPENFRPDAGISFKATFNEHTAHPMKHEPSGTNLFDAVQAEGMVRYMTEGMPSSVATYDELGRMLASAEMNALWHWHHDEELKAAGKGEYGDAAWHKERKSLFWREPNAPS